MSDDWQPGDLALCVKTGPIKFGPRWHQWGLGIGLRRGHRYIVRAYAVEASPIGGNPIPRLYLINDAYGRFALRFRRLPRHALDAEDRETIALLNGKPVRELVDDTRADNPERLGAPSPVFEPPHLEASSRERPHDHVAG